MELKKLLIIGFAGVAMVSCNSKDDVTEPTGNVSPRISAELAGMGTRAYDNAWEVNDLIGISCTSSDETDYTNMKYSTTAGDGNFTHVDGQASGIFFQGKEDVTFTAYYPFTGAEGQTPTCNVSTADQSDLKQRTFDYLFTTGAKANKANPQVSFKGVYAFQHKMTRLIIRIVPNGDADVTVDDLKKATTAHPDGNGIAYRLRNIKLNGAFDPVNGTAAASGDASPLYTFSDTADEKSYVVDDNGTATEAGVYYSLIFYPQTLAADATLGFSALLNGAEYNCDLNPTPTLEAGKSYIYTVKVSKTALEVVDCEIDDWTDVTNPGQLEAK